MKEEEGGEKSFARGSVVKPAVFATKAGGKNLHRSLFK